MDLVSVIVPAYNVEDYIDRCIKSILSQSYENMEIIIIDDGSKDNTFLKCEEARKKDSRIFVYRQENFGVSVARNIGIEKAKGNYICFVDADDYVDSMYVEIMISNIKNTKADMAVTMCSRNEILTTSKIQKKNNIELWNNKDALTNLLCRDIYANGVVGKLYKKEIIKNLKFKENLKIGEDKLFVYSAVDICRNIVFQDISLYCYCTRNGSAMNSKFDDRYLDVIKVNEALYKRWTYRYPEMTDLFKKEVIISYVRCIQNGINDDSKKARYIREIFINKIKNCKTKEILKYCNKKEKILFLLEKNAITLLKIYENKKK